MQLIFWNTYPELNLSYFEWLLQNNAQELILAKKLAEEVSILSNRPVLTLHNATLGAPSGWGMPSFETQLNELYPYWQKEVKHLFIQTKNKLKKETEVLISYWLKRLIISQKKEIYRNYYFQEKKRLSIFYPLLISILKTYKIFGKNINMLIVPFIDKFIRSSLGGTDIVYLKAFLNLILSEVPEIIVLFFDETPHPQGPTLKLAIKKLNEESEWIKGIGVYGKGENVNSEIILKYTQKYQIFFLSLLSGQNNPHSWWEIRTYYPRDYHPAWRDGLTELFSGTRVAFLTQEIKREEVVTDKGKMLLGVYFRLKLKQLSHTFLCSDPFWCFYETLANLS